MRAKVWNPNGEMNEAKRFQLLQTEKIDLKKKKTIKEKKSQLT